MTAAVTLSPPPILQFFNNAGLPNVGGSILTQVGGVNTATYQDSAGTIPLPNPIPLNSRGEVSNASGVSCQLFLTAGVAYTFTMFDANGNQIDQAAYVAPPSSAASIYTPPGAGAVATSVANALNAYRSGEVRFVQDFAGNWVAYDPWGNTISLTGTTTQGLQEAYNFARTNHYDLKVIGQGYVFGQTGQSGMIHCTSTLTMGPMWGNRVRFEQVTLVLDPTTPANSGWTIDTMDFSSIEFDGQILYTGTGVGVQGIPTTDNGETFIGMTTSRIALQTCVCIVSFANFAVDTTKGTCFSITPSTHAVVNNTIIVGETNGGLFGFRVDTPGVAGQFCYNEIHLPGCHTQATTCLQVGSGNTLSSAAIRGNQWFANLSPNVNGAIIYGNNDIYSINISGGSGSGITFQTTASQNRVNCALNNATTAVTDGSTAKDNFYNGSGLKTQYTLTGAPIVVSAANTYTPVKFDTYDDGVNNVYVPATGLFTPTLQGDYLVSVQMSVNGLAAGNYVDVAIYKNGVLARESECLSPGAYSTQTCSTIITCNGTTDNISFYARSVNAAASVQNIGILSYFYAVKI